MSRPDLFYLLTFLLDLHSRSKNYLTRDRAFLVSPPLSLLSNHPQRVLTTNDLLVRSLGDRQLDDWFLSNVVQQVRHDEVFRIEHFVVLHVMYERVVETYPFPQLVVKHVRIVMAVGHLFTVMAND